MRRNSHKLHKGTVCMHRFSQAHSPQAMEEELEHTSLGVGKPLVLTPIATEDHGSKRKTLRGLRSRI